MAKEREVCVCWWVTLYLVSLYDQVLSRDLWTLLCGGKLVKYYKMPCAFITIIMHLIDEGP